MITHSNTSLFAGLLATALFTSVASAQNVGIGTTTPKSKLSVNGTTASGGMAIGDATYTSTTGTAAPLNGAIIQGFTGIGTTNPLFRLSLEGNGSSNWDSAIFVNSTSSTPTGAFAPHLVLRVSDNSGLAANDIFGRFIAQSQPGGAQANATGMDALHRGFSGANPLTALRFLTCEGAGPVERMRISETGNVGIGDSTPTEAQLVVRGAGTGNITGGRTQFSYNSALGDFAGTFAISPSIYASSAIVAEGNLIAGISVISANSLTVSDSRLKNVEGLSDTASDLETLGKIRITDYTMKDPFMGGHFKKVIAQQVESVYPQAVSKGAGYLPDVAAKGRVAAKGDGIFEIQLDAPHGLQPGTKVKLVHPSGEAEFSTVEASGDKSFAAKLHSAKDGSEIFVHGRQVDDLRTVDYDALSMLNISATQELARKVSGLEAENAKLKADNAALSAAVSDLAALKQAVAALQAKGEEGAVRTVSLTK